MQWCLAIAGSGCAASSPCRASCKGNEFKDSLRQGRQSLVLLTCRRPTARDAQLISSLACQKMCQGPARRLPDMCLGRLLVVRQAVFALALLIDSGYIRNKFTGCCSLKERVSHMPQRVQRSCKLLQKRRNVVPSECHHEVPRIGILKKDKETSTTIFSWRFAFRSVNRN